MKWEETEQGIPLARRADLTDEEFVEKLMESPLFELRLRPVVGVDITIWQWFKRLFKKERDNDGD